MRAKAVPCPLSPRELEVLAGVAQGLTTEALARALRNSPQTVKNHLVQVLDKLAAPNRTAAVVIALQEGWLQLAAVHVRRRTPAAPRGLRYAGAVAAHATA